MLSNSNTKKWEHVFLISWLTIRLNWYTLWQFGDSKLTFQGHPDDRARPRTFEGARRLDSCEDCQDQHLQSTGISTLTPPVHGHASTS